MDQEELWQQIAKQLGIPPQAAQQQYRDGTLQKNLLQSIQQNESLQRILQNPEELQKLLSSPQARMLLQVWNRKK